VPVLQWELAGDQGGLPAMSILQDLKEITALRVSERGQAVVIQDAQFGLLKTVQQLRIRSIRPRESEFSEQA